MLFKNKIVCVTGAAGGIGKSIVCQFLKNGSIVVAIDKKLKNKEVNNYYYKYKCDVTSEIQIKKLIKFIIKKYNKIDIFFSNAGILTVGDEKTKNKDWKLNWDVHLMSHVYISRMLKPIFQNQKNGHLVVTSSAAGLLTHLDSISYSVTKQASVAFAEWTAIDYLRFNCYVSVLCPQAVNTNMIPM